MIGRRLQTVSVSQTRPVNWTHFVGAAGATTGAPIGLRRTSTDADGGRGGCPVSGRGGQTGQRFGANPIADVRDAVDFLLYDTIKLENRFEECATESGGFGLAGAGKEWPSYLLTLREPTLFAPWSPHTERTLRRLGMLPSGFRNGHPGLCYIDLLDTLGILARRLRLPDFRSLDEFCYLNGRQKRAGSGQSQANPESKLTAED